MNNDTPVRTSFSAYLKKLVHLHLNMDWSQNVNQMVAKKRIKKKTAQNLLTFLATSCFPRCFTCCAQKKKTENATRAAPPHRYTSFRHGFVYVAALIWINNWMPCRYKATSVAKKLQSHDSCSMVFCCGSCINDRALFATTSSWLPLTRDAARYQTKNNGPIYIFFLVLILLRLISIDSCN